MMWMLEVDRGELVEAILGQSTRLHGAHEVQSTSIVSSRSELQLLWREDPSASGPFPAAIVVGAKGRLDLMAWIATYLGPMRPFSAFCRILERETIENYLQVNEQPNLAGFDEACIGLIFGEGAAYTIGRNESKWLPLAAYTATLSFPLARCMALDLPGTSVPDLRERWMGARESTNQSRLRFDPQLLDEPWEVLWSLVRGRAPKMLSSVSQLERNASDLRMVADACESIHRHGDIQPQQWAHMTSRLAAARNAEDLSVRPREDRVLAVRYALLEIFADKAVSPTIRSFLCGYLANQVGPGSFEHFGLLSPVAKTLPVSLMWYGLCGGLRRRSGFNTESGVVGMRVLRELLRREKVLDWPKCDIALPELQLLGANRDVRTTFLTGSQSHIDVELLPCVNSTMRLGAHPPEHSTSISAPSQRDLFTNDVDAQTLMRDLDHALGKVESIRDRIQNVMRRSKKMPIKRTRKRRG